MVNTFKDTKLELLMFDYGHVYTDEFDKSIEGILLKASPASTLLESDGNSSNDLNANDENNSMNGKQDKAFDGIVAAMEMIVVKTICREKM